jgi:hypothetical protein
MGRDAGHWILPVITSNQDRIAADVFITMVNEQAESVSTTEK